MTRPTLFTRADNSHDSEFRGLINKPNKDHAIWIDALSFYGKGFSTPALRSVARMIYRTYNVNQIPHVVGFLWSATFDDYGNNLRVEVQYDKCGWRAVYGGKLTPAGYIWQCYMD